MLEKPHACVKSFEHRLDRFWAGQPIRFDHESHIVTTSSRDTMKIIADDSDLDIDVMFTCFQKLHKKTYG